MELCDQKGVLRNLFRHILMVAGSSRTACSLTKGRGQRDTAHSDDEESDEQPLRSERLMRAFAYYADPGNSHTLDEHAIVKQMCDRLFYRLFGGLDKAAPHYKVFDLLTTDGSPMVECMATLQELISGGLHDADHKCWVLLYWLKAPVAGEEYHNRVLGNILRMLAAFVTLVALPPSHTLLCRVERGGQAIRRRGFVTRSVVLLGDSFARAPSVEVLSSRQAAVCIQMPLGSMRLVTDFGKMSRAQCRCASRSATGPQAFGAIARGVLLKHAARARPCSVRLLALGRRAHIVATPSPAPGAPGRYQLQDHSSSPRIQPALDGQTTT